MAKISLGQAKRARKLWQKARKKFLRSFGSAVDEKGHVKSEDMLHEKIKEVFEMYDTDKNGTIELDEFRNAMIVTCKCIFLSKDDVRAMFQVADIDGDGKLEFGEFQKIVMSQILEAEQASQGLTGLCALL